MKINGTSEPLRPDRVAAPGDSRTAATTNADPVSESERVHLSDLGAKLNQLEASFGEADFDVKKVEAVRTAIAEGRFKVNADAVADKLLSSVSELLGKR
jgi:negative regulator of flagellin synthesis FlgM